MKQIPLYFCPNFKKKEKGLYTYKKNYWISVNAYLWNCFGFWKNIMVLQEYMPKASLHGCWFHWIQAVHCKVKKLQYYALQSRRALFFANIS